VDENMRTLLDVWDQRKNGLDTREMGSALASRWSRLEEALVRLGGRGLPALPPSVSDLYTGALAFAPAKAENPVSREGATVEDLSLVYAGVHAGATRAALKEYFAAGASAPTGRTLYERGSRALNLLIKDNLLSRMERDAALLSAGASLDALSADPSRGRRAAEARELYVYLMLFYDARNFPEFPSGPAFLKADQYFAMGDNRYNSLDFRFSTTRQVRRLDEMDPASVVYSSMLAPFPLEKRFIEGWATFRLWPPARMGVIR
jgi:hypothetical protein